MSAPRHCTVCGGPLPRSQTGDVCPACLLRFGLRSREEDLRAELAGIQSAEERVEFVELSCADDAALKGRLLGAMRTEAVSWGDFTNRPGVSAPGGFRAGSEGDTDLESGCLGWYRLCGKLGEGGFGAVYRAEQSQPMRRTVALKVLKPGMDTEQVIARFEAERQALAMMDHPNIARVLDAGRTRSGRPFFVMELVAGEPITTFCAANRLDLEERLRLFIQVCDGLQHAHQKGIIHRDVKPSNVLATGTREAAQAKVIDFGIAKATQQALTDATLLTTLHQVVGTPAYISPEQVLAGGQGVDTRSDVYSAGVLLYELLTGVTPFDHRELRDAGLEGMCRVIREREPIRPSVRLRQNATDPEHRSRLPLSGSLPADLDWIVLKCLQKDRNHRYATANGLAMDLRRFLDHEPVLARPLRLGYRWGKWVRRNPVVAGLGAVLAVGLIAAAAAGNWMVLRLTRAKAETEQANFRLSDMVHRLEWEKVESFVAGERRYRALPWFAQVLRRDPHDAVAASRVLSMLTLNSFALPLGPILRLDGPVPDARFDADAKRLLTASWDGTVRLWAVPSGRELRRWAYPTEVQSAQWALGERRVVLESHGHFLDVRDVDTEAVILHRAGRKGRFSGLVSADDRTLFAFDDNVGLTAWDLDSGRRVWDSMPLPSPVRAAGQSKRGEVLGLGLDNGELWAVETSTRRRIAALGPLGLPYEELVFHPSGDRIFVTVPDARRIVTWRFRTESEPRMVSVPEGAGVNNLVFPTDAPRFATRSAADWPRLWDAETFQILATATTVRPGMGGFHFDAKGSVVAIHNQHGVARVFDGASLEPFQEPIEHPSPVVAGDIDRLGALLATGCQDGSVRFWDVRMRQPAEVLFPTNLSRAVEAEFSPDGGRVLLSVGLDTLQVSDSWTGRAVGPALRLPRHREDPHIWRAGFSPDGTRVFGAGRDGRVRVWEAGSGRVVGDWTLPLVVSVAAFSPDGKRMLVGGGKGLTFIAEVSSGRVVEPPCQDSGEVTGLACDPRGGRFAASYAEGWVRLWDLREGHSLGDRMRHGGIVWSVAFSREGGRLVTASADRTAQVWDAGTGVRIGKPMRLEKEVLWACFSANGQRVLTTGSDGGARVWDAATGDPISPVMSHGGAVWQGRFSPDGQTVATGSLDGTARLWDAVSGLPLTEPLRHPTGVLRVGFSPDGRRLLTYGGERARIWDVLRAPAPVPPWLPELIEAVAGMRWMPDGQFVPAPPEPIERLRSEVAGERPTDFYRRWARWFLVRRLEVPAPRFDAVGPSGGAAGLAAGGDAPSR